MKARPMGFLLILIGLCFFFNPYMAAIDVLPDFIGCLLIALGLVPSSRVFWGLKDARRRFLILAALDAVKQLMLVFIFSNTALGEQEVLLLIVAFLSATVETLFAVLAMHTLFGGLAWMLDSFGRKDLVTAPVGSRSRTERLARFTVIFIILKEALLLLPEFAALLNSTYVYSNFVNLYDYIGLMRALVIFPVLGLGIAWLCAVISYFIRLLRDRDFMLDLQQQYTSYLSSHPGVRIMARYFLALLLLSFGAFFLTDFYLDFKNIISDTVGGCLLLAGVLLLGAKKKVWLPAAVSAMLYTVIAAISGAKSYNFVSSHIGADITRSEEVAAQYTEMWLFALFELLVFLAFLAFLLLTLRAILIKWGGYRPEHTDADFEERHERRIRDEFDWYFIKCYIFGFISALLSFLFDYIKTWPDTEKLRYFARLMEALWIPDFIMALFFAVYFSYLLTLVFAKIGERFQYE